MTNAVFAEPEVSIISLLNLRTIYKSGQARWVFKNLVDTQHFLHFALSILQNSI